MKDYSDEKGLEQFEKTQTEVNENRWRTFAKKFFNVNHLFLSNNKALKAHQKFNWEF